VAHHFTTYLADKPKSFFNESVESMQDVYDERAVRMASVMPPGESDPMPNSRRWLYRLLTRDPRAYASGQLKLLL
jgi:hypothetical protein